MSVRTCDHAFDPCKLLCTRCGVSVAASHIEVEPTKPTSERENVRMILSSPLGIPPTAEWLEWLAEQSRKGNV